MNMGASNKIEDENKRLYPLRFIDEGEDTAWGHVSYHVADLGFKDSMVSEGWFAGNTISELMGTYMERVTGDDAFEFYGLQFPVMLKVMDVTGRQPLQMTVSDNDAAERYDSFGKTALWYVEEASEDAVVYLGFNRDMDASEFYARCQTNTVEEVLNVIHPHKGDAFLIKPGTLFAAGNGLKIVEIAESSELVFNVHSWGASATEDEQLMLEEAFDMIDFRMNDQQPLRDIRIADEPEFRVTRMDLDAALKVSSEQPGSFALYHCVKGEASVQVSAEGGSGSMVDYPLTAGHTILVPSELTEFYLVPMKAGTVLLETLVEKRSQLDEYTGEEAQRESLTELSEDPHVRNWN